MTGWPQILILIGTGVCGGVGAVRDAPRCGLGVSLAGEIIIRGGFLAILHAGGFFS